jgi:hypothetical protein
MSRSNAWPIIAFLPIGLLQLALAAAFIYFVVGPKRLTIDDHAVEVAGSWWSHTRVDRDAVIADQVRLIDFDRERELAPRGRTNGLDLLGYQEGWFRLHNGDKAFVVLSRKKSVVYIPTRAGFAILYTPSDPEQLVASFH